MTSAEIRRFLFDVVLEALEVQSVGWSEPIEQAWRAVLDCCFASRWFLVVPGSRHTTGAWLLSPTGQVSDDVRAAARTLVEPIDGLRPVDTFPDVYLGRITRGLNRSPRVDRGLRRRRR